VSCLKQIKSDKFNYFLKIIIILSNLWNLPHSPPKNNTKKGERSTVDPNTESVYRESKTKVTQQHEHSKNQKAARRQSTSFSLFNSYSIWGRAARSFGAKQ